MEKYRAETNIEIQTTEYTWIVRNYSKFRGYELPDLKICSPTFCTPVEGINCKWVLYLYPYCFYEWSRGHYHVMKMCLSGTDVTPSCSTHFKISVIKPSEKKLVKIFSTNFISTDVNLDLYYYDIKERKFAFPDCMVNGDLVIEIEVTYIKSIINTEWVLKIEKEKNARLDRRLSGIDDLKQLFTNMKLSDVKIMVGDEEIAAHKCILAASSSVFLAMFDHDTEENKENVVRITDVDHKVMMELARFMYCGEVENVREIATDLLVAADKYDISSLRVMCEEVLINELSVENINNLLIFIDTFPKATQLRAATLTFIASHLKELDESQGFKEVVMSLSPQLAELIDDIASKALVSPAKFATVTEKYQAETYIDIETTEYTWIVRNFILFHHCTVREFQICSPTFCTRVEGIIFKWFLYLYPGEDSGDEGYVRMSIVLSDTNVTLSNRTLFEISIVEPTSKRRFGKSFERNFTSSSGNSERYNIVKRNDVFSNCLSNGDLVIEISVSHYKGKVNTESVLKINEKKNPILECRLSRIDDLKQLFTNMKLSDVKIMVGDKEIAAHKCILAARSPVFSTMFDHENEENKENVVRITDVDHKVMLEVVRFMYCGEVENIEEIATNLLVAADKYDISSLREMCEEVLINE